MVSCISRQNYDGRIVPKWRSQESPAYNDEANESHMVVVQVLIAMSLKNNIPTHLLTGDNV